MVFPYFLQFKPEVCSKEQMIWASQLQVLFLLIIELLHHNPSDFGIDHLVMFTWRVISCVVGKECWLSPVHSLGKTVLVSSLGHLALHSQTCLLLQVSLDFLLLHSNPLWWKGHLFFFLVLVLEGLVGDLHKIDFSFFSISGWGIDLDYCDIEWFALETNQDHSVIFEITPKLCTSVFC